MVVKTEIDVKIINDYAQTKWNCAKTNLWLIRSGKLMLARKPLYFAVRLRSFAYARRNVSCLSERYIRSQVPNNFGNLSRGIDSVTPKTSYIHLIKPLKSVKHLPQSNWMEAKPNKKLVRRELREATIAACAVPNLQPFEVIENKKRKH